MSIHLTFCCAICAGEYISTPCTSTSKMECSACKKQCPPGFYMQGSCSSGATSYDAVQFGCIACKKSCEAGTYRSTLCAGNTTVDTTTCKPCLSQCAEGELLFTAFLHTLFCFILLMPVFLHRRIRLWRVHRYRHFQPDVMQAVHSVSP